MPSTGYERLKQRAGALDFVDLLLRARDLLAGHPRVRRAFQSRFTHIFVDEFQDTDPLQAEILLLLAADDPAEARVAADHAGSRQAVHRRRPETGDLSLPAGRRRNLSGSLRSARGTRRQARVPAHELSRDAGDPAGGERGLRPAHDRRSRDAAGAVRRIVALPPRRDRPAVGDRAAGARAVWAAACGRLRDREVAARPRSAPSSIGC